MPTDVEEGKKKTDKKGGGGFWEYLQFGGMAVEVARQSSNRGRYQRFLQIPKVYNNKLVLRASTMSETEAQPIPPRILGGSCHLP